ncbi:family 4 glycosyltransferasen [Oleiphilus messinensis]|uniref:tRNA-queuosine alpha-mannosyltransferase n=1 Tax=Oleiphilus messinensis TaxID=141451 RepID=A0A1Y0I864_9GAMM|nr:DUF3524 domain-containing protein [Oleiphilus messinensis]ARU56692.1 family 4 glycosyltransferasen [Oleiphilus messinensis]
MRILLLSPYDATSHQYWRTGLVKHFPQHDWTVLTLPPRYFSWRIRGNSLSWTCSERERLEQNYDVLIATSMTDLASLRGFIPGLARIPTLLYFHENQFAYPASKTKVESIEPQIVTLYGAIAADRLIFNSEFNRKTFLSGVKTLLKKLPDHAPLTIVSLLQKKSEVLMVPLEDCLWEIKHEANKTSSSSPLVITWNHRWEYDKGPEKLLAVVDELLTRSVNFKINILGQQFRSSPVIFNELEEKLRTTRNGKHLGTWGFIKDRARYFEILKQSDIVLSTAIHDFQGLSMLEAVALGCIPLAPDTLVYPEWFPAEYLYSEDQRGHTAVDKILNWIEEKKNNKLPVAPDVKFLSWQSLSSRYASAIDNTLER